MEKIRKLTISPQTKVKNNSTKRVAVQKASTKKPSPKFGATVKRRQQVANSKSSFKAQQAAFKPRPKVSTKTVNNRSVNTRQYSTSNPIISRSSGYNRTTYISRRSDHYGN